jgi:Ca-activated chloride channel family protein
MNWAAPEYAWLALLAIPATLLSRHAWRKRRQALGRLSGAAPGGYPWKSLVLPSLAAALLFAALCRPQWGVVMAPRESRGLDILIALDVSRSMLADDAQPNRLALAKRSIFGLLGKLHGDRIGLIAFAGSAFLICPPTNDYASFAAVLNEAGPATLPLGGTTLAAPLAEARRAYTGTPGTGKALILVSDGEDHGEDADALHAAVTALHGAGVKLYGAVVGTPAGGLIPRGDGRFQKDRAGNIVHSRAHADTLRTFTDGLFDLNADPQALERLRETEMANLTTRATHASSQQLAERFQIPLALALTLLLIERLFSLVTRAGRP